MQATIAILFILAIAFIWWLYEKHDSMITIHLMWNTKQRVVIITENQWIRDFTKINKI